MFVNLHLSLSPKSASGASIIPPIFTLPPDVIRSLSLPDVDAET